MFKFILILSLSFCATLSPASRANPSAASPIVMSQQIARQLFSVAEKEWLAAYNDDLIKWFEKLANGDTKGLTPQKIEEIRRARVLAQRLRSLYYFLDQRHEPPADFHEFVKKFGKLKDSLVAGEKIKNKSSKVLKVLKATDPVANLDFIPTDKASFDLFAQKRLENIMLLAESRTLVFDDHHTLRKQLRDFMTLIRLVKKQDASPELQNLYKQMKLADAELGEAHDALEVEKIKGSKSDKREIETVQLEISPAVRKLASSLNDYWLGRTPSYNQKPTLNCGGILTHH